MSPDGGINPHSKTVGILVLVRQGVNVESKMLTLHAEIVDKPFVDELRVLVAGTSDLLQLSRFYRAVLSSVGLTVPTS